MDAPEKRPENPADGKVDFSARETWRRLKRWGGVFHFVTLLTALLMLLSANVVLKERDSLHVAPDSSTNAARQAVLEALDKVVRYQHYHKELNGKYSQDLRQLTLPKNLSGFSFDEVFEAYEIHVLDVNSEHLLVEAVGRREDVRQDRVFIDESHRVRTNFPAPMLSKAYLREEAARFLSQVAISSEDLPRGLAADYWRVEPLDDQGEWVAVGLKPPVMKEKIRHSSSRQDYAFAAAGTAGGGRGPASLFSGVREQVRGATEPAVGSSGAREILSREKIYFVLRQARHAQFVFQKEKGYYTKSWEDLERVSGIAFREFAEPERSNVRWNPIEVTQAGFEFSLEGVAGNLAGELFLIDRNGTIRQARYSELLLNRLRQSGKGVRQPASFQGVAEEDAAVQRFP